MFYQQSPKQNQAGVVLVISLIMLLLLTLIGITSVQVTSLEEKMAGNVRSQNIAFQSAETALRAAERVLTQAVLPDFTASGTNGLYLETATAPDEYDDWSTFNVVSYSDNNLVGVASSPEYIIHKMVASITTSSGSASLDAGGFTENEMYRVTARAVGGTTSAVAVLQTIYKR